MGKVVLTAVWALIGVASIVPAITTPFLFDAPGSESNSLTVALAIAAVLLPVCFPIGAFLQWVVRLRHAFFIVPLLDFAAIVVIVIALQIFCGGSFAC